MSSQMPQTVAEHLQQSHAANADEIDRLETLCAETEAKLANARAERAVSFNPGTDSAVIGLESDLARFRSALRERINVQTELGHRLRELGLDPDDEPDDDNGPDDDDDESSEDAGDHTSVAGPGVRSSVGDATRPLLRLRARGAAMPLPTR